MEPVNPNTCIIQRDSENPLSYWDKYCLCQLYPPGINGFNAPFCDTLNTQTANPTPNPTPNPTLRPTIRPTIRPSTTIIPTTTQQPTDTPTTKPPTNRPTSLTNIPTTSPSINNIDEFCLNGGGILGTNIHINGHYIRQDLSDNNGNTYYKNDRISCDINMYIYKYNRFNYDSQTNTFYPATVWAINYDLNIPAPIAVCNEEFILNCDRNWIIGNQFDRNLRVFEGKCPIIGCKQLILNGTGNFCDGIYDELSDNYYTKNDSVLIYNDFYEEYRCVSTNNIGYINSCDNYDNIDGSDSSIIPTDLNSVIVPWRGHEGFEVKLECKTTTTTTPAPVVPPRSLITCGGFIDDSITQGGIHSLK